MILDAINNNSKPVAEKTNNNLFSVTRTDPKEGPQGFVGEVSGIKIFVPDNDTFVAKSGKTLTPIYSRAADGKAVRVGFLYEIKKPAAVEKGLVVGGKINLDKVGHSEFNHEVVGFIARDKQGNNISPARLNFVKSLPKKEGASTAAPAANVVLPF